MAKWLTGFHAVEESLKGNVNQANLYVTGENERTQSIIRLAKKKGIPFRSVSKSKLIALTSIREAKDCALQIFKESKTSASMPKEKSATLEDFLEKIEKEKREKATVLILDCITDPHNLGAMLRSADQFNVDCVIIPQRGSAKESATVMKTSAGAARYVKIFVVPNLKRSIELLKRYHFWIYGADIEGTPLVEEVFSPRRALIMGNEGSGMRPLTAGSCDKIITIPTQGHIDSLNVSVACGILLYEFYRQTLS